MLKKSQRSTKGVLCLSKCVIKWWLYLQSKSILWCHSGGLKTVSVPFIFVFPPKTVQPWWPRSPSNIGSLLWLCCNLKTAWHPHNQTQLITGKQGVRKGGNQVCPLIKSYNNYFIMYLKIILINFVSSSTQVVPLSHAITWQMSGLSSTVTSEESLSLGERELSEPS